MRYLDTSALVKLVLAEEESTALSALLDDGGNQVSSVVTAVELLRAARRQAPDELPRARDVLGSVNLIALDDVVRARAAALDPPTLRSLDAIHVASALILRPALGSLVTYDARMAEAAEAAGITVEAPG